MHYSRTIYNLFTEAVRQNTKCSNPFFRRRRKSPKYFIDHPPPGDVTYHAGMYTKEQPDMVPRHPTTPMCVNRGQPEGPEHSHYTHVWELRSAPKPQGDKLAGIHKEKLLALRSFLGHGHGQHRKEHIYESPKFERCPGCPHPTLPRDPRDPAFFHLAHPHHHPHNANRTDYSQTSRHTHHWHWPRLTQSLGSYSNNDAAWSHDR